MIVHLHTTLAGPAGVLAPGRHDTEQLPPALAAQLLAALPADKAPAGRPRAARREVATVRPPETR